MKKIARNKLIEKRGGQLIRTRCSLGNGNYTFQTLSLFPGLNGLFVAEDFTDAIDCQSGPIVIPF